MEEKSTKNAIIETGVRIMMEKGYNHTGLQEVLQSSGVPKGSFYHFFASKEAFGLAVVDRYVDDFTGYLAQHLDNGDHPPLARLRNFFEATVGRYDTEGCCGGCMVGNIGQELSDQNEAFRERIADSYQGLQKQFAACLTEARTRGELPAATDPGDMADFLLDSWEGAILRMKVTKSTEPLHRFIRYTFAEILKSP